MKATLLALSLLGCAFASQAVEYTQVLPEKSSIVFGYQQMGVPMEGRFRKFSAQIGFDPAKPAAARASVDIDLASIDTGVPEADEEAVGKSWFNVKAYPTARFVASSVKALGGNRYELAGKLTLKGRTQDIVAPLTYVAQGNQAVFDGSFSFKRADFAIGEGAWAAFDTVANEIRIKFHVLAVIGK